MHFDNSFSRVYIYIYVDHLAMEAASELKRLWRGRRERGRKGGMRHSLKGRVYEDLAYVSRNVR